MIFLLLWLTPLSMTLSRSIHVAANGLISFFIYIYIYIYILGFPCGSAGKESTCNAEDLDSIPELGRSPGEGKGYPLQYSGLENSLGRKESGMTERLSLCFIYMCFIYIYIYICICMYIYIHTPHLFYPFLCQWTCRLLPCLGHCKQCCSEHWVACIFLYVFLWICTQEWHCRVI